jgi:hypothetical protein
MELKHLRLLPLSLLLIHTAASALSINDVLDQVLAYPRSLFNAEGQDPTAYASTLAKGKTPFKASFPCCGCNGCICSHTSCPEIAPFPSPPIAKWPIEDGTPKEIAEAGCGEEYSFDACLHFVQQYLQALQPALEEASNHSRDHYEDVNEKGKKKVVVVEEGNKVACCGDPCTDTQCLRYLALTVKNLQGPINETLQAGEYVVKDEKPVSEEPEEAAKSEL